MKKIHILLAFSCLTTFSVIGQTLKIVTPQEYDQLKSSGQLKENTVYFQKPGEMVEVNKEEIRQNDAPYTGQRVNDGSCQCMLPIDNTFSLVPMSGYSSPYRNDDGSSSAISLPFNFCMYGTQYTSLYINNNGNVSFGSSYSTFSSSPFPSASYTMVAPFWGDVDTRNSASGLVYYKLTSDYLIVRWQTVGYYSSYADKLNDFQLIISNGNDTLIPGNNNVAFCYGDMQWTTGDASQGSNGFGGVPSTVGINKGDGVNFIQLGRFDQPGTAYDGAYGNPDGVSWLDNQTFYFNVCGSATNLPPIITSSNSYSCVPDTILLCTNTDTLVRSIQFSGPENGQIITPSVSAPTLPGAINTSSSTANGITTVTFTVIANPGVVGTHLITVTGTDNGTPNLSTSISFIIDIPNVTLPAPVLSVSPSGPICGNVGATVSLNNCPQYTTIQWADGSNGCSVVLNATGSTNVTVIAGNGCTKTSFMNVDVNPIPQPTITGNLNFCNNNGTVLGSTVTGTSVGITDYSWSIPGAGNNPTATANSAGQVVLTVTDANGCIGSDTVTVTNITPPVNISPSTTSFCPGVGVTLTSSISGGSSYTWTSTPAGAYPGNDVITVNPTVSTVYTLTVVNNGCTSTNSITLNPQSTALINSINNPIVCDGQVPTLTANVSPLGSTVTWIPSSGGPALTGTSITGAPNTTYTVQATISGSCPSADSIVTTFPTSPAVVPIIIDTDPNPFDTILCYKTDKYLTETITGGTAPYTYLWSPASGSNATNDTCKISLAGDYILTVTDANGCIGRDTIEIDLIQPTLLLSGNPFICPTDTARIVATGTSASSFTINWTPSSLGHNDTVYTTLPGQYIATIIDDVYGCTETKYYNVSYYPIPNANFTVDPEPSEVEIPALIQSTSTISSGTIVAAYWNFGDNTTASPSNTQIHSWNAPGSYPVTLIVESNRGCLDTVTIEHEVYVIIPAVNIITPNGDNVNNALRFKGLEFYPDAKISIFNRWGNKIYESDHYDNKWDGDGAAAGTYYYILEVPDLKYQEKIITSFFQIIK